MSVIGSILLLALGAILWFAAGWHGVGLALMIVGAVAAAVSLGQLVLSARRGRRPPAQPM
jgi:O-antigen/teichoic acid export membrane protein